VTIGNRDLNSIDLHWWRSQLGLVQQEPFLFNDTIYKNVEYGLVNTEYEHASEEVKRTLVERACKDAYADEFIRNLPEVQVVQSDNLSFLLMRSRDTPHLLVKSVFNSAVANGSGSPSLGLLYGIQRY
jgi:ABC-type multidrug transport system fused ATPase/permease subunit